MNCNPVAVKGSIATAEKAQFGTDVTDEKKLAVYSKVFVLKKTDSNTTWAVQNFKAWCNGNEARIQKIWCQLIC